MFTKLSQFSKISQFVKIQKLFSTQKRPNINEIPMLQDFLKKQNNPINIQQDKVPYLTQLNLNQNKKYFIETYGCQMNQSDTEIINGILQNSGYQSTKVYEEADIVFLNTCAIREGAESKIWRRLEQIRAEKKKEKKSLITGVLGCMAERLKYKLVEKNKVVDIIAGPDAYKDLPRLIESLIPNSNNFSINVQLSLDETYADVTPIRQNPEGPEAYVSIMKGCNNMCSFCIVPFTRGRERSRSIESIIKEVEILRNEGVKQITLLGQNVNSYHDKESEEYEEPHLNPQGFKETYKLRQVNNFNKNNRTYKKREKVPDSKTYLKKLPKQLLKPDLDLHLHIPKTFQIQYQMQQPNILILQKIYICQLNAGIQKFQIE
ncbi:hypothetical protein IMG5_160390 [Ichthyophthirius multifiliis]|uniref:Uncharacterized protein n=1 Tax=Ichthyophthirius multifiliis TaxID=5932 RepID=G0QZX8_ICHMU|nr:hypothetical protein IMG5_160390 [Ichthyophthirius multifiliis]EGR29240.1 hypothetical protein IMG5_160390 [Ichthyophthirius multifiliis]|eukprot:XP_004030476.1 hypothetical protein IMG5_160390 [Ichthyophthirius multifiliis]